MEAWFTVSGVLGAITFLVTAVAAGYLLKNHRARAPVLVVTFGLSSVFAFRAIRAATHYAFGDGMIWASFLVVMCGMVWVLFTLVQVSAKSGGNGT